MGTTRRQLVTDTLDILKDLRVLTATRDGADVTFYDDKNLVGEPGSYTGREVLFVAGTAANIGEVRYVTGSALNGIGFGLSLPATTATGDECWMVNTRGIGYRFDDVYRAINQAIRAARHYGPVVAGSDTVVYASGDAVAIPPEFVRVENVLWQDGNDDAVWRTIVKARTPHGSGWWIDKASRTIHIGGNAATKIDGRTVKIWGLAEPAELHSDDDETEVNGDWIAHTAAWTIARGRFMRSPTPETERTMFSAGSEAASLRPLIVTRRGPFGEDV